MSKTVTAGLNTHIGQEVTTTCMLWQVTRVDGQAFYFTDLDQNVVFETHTYKASTGFMRTGITSDIAFSVDNLDVAGIFDDADIKENDLRNGLFDGADVRIALINYESTVDGILKLRRGILGEATDTEKGWFKIELRGLNQFLQQNIGSLYQPTCRADLGDSKCQVGINPVDLVLGQQYYAGQYAKLRRILPFESAGVFSDFGAIDVTELTNFDVDNLDAVVGSLRAGNDGGREGTFYLWGGVAQSQVIVRHGDTDPDLDLVALPSWAGALTDIDAGKIRVNLQWWQGRSDSDDLATMGIAFYDGTNPATANLIGSINYAPSISTATWTSRNFQVNIPTGARALTWYFKFDRVGSGDCNGKIDSYSLRLEYNIGDLTDYGDRVIKCIKDGIAPYTYFSAANSSYVKSTTGGVPDAGTNLYTSANFAQFQVIAAWKIQATVTSVVSNQIFRATIDGFGNNWFRYGGVQWITGLNAGKVSMEVKDYLEDSPSAGTATITLFLPMNFNVQVGDKFTIYAGCDKAIGTCATKFSNAVNFRGEPHVPGTDYLSSYPDA